MRARSEIHGPGGDDERERRRLFTGVTTTTMVVASATLAAIMVAQPELIPRALVALTAVNLLGVVLLEVSRRGRTRFASVLLICGFVALVTGMALTAGGIRSPGVTMYFVFVLMTGLLLGRRAGALAAIACGALGLTL